MSDVFLGNPFGGAYTAPKGTLLPTDAVSSLDRAFIELGLISDEGYADSDQRQFKEVEGYTSGGNAWPHLMSRTESFQLTLLETNEVVLAQVYGDDNVTTSGSSIAVAHRLRGMATPRSYVLDTITENRVRRQVIPLGIVTEVGEIENSKKSVVGYDITIRAVADETGATAYTYIATLKN